MSESNDVDLPVREMAREVAPEVPQVRSTAPWLERDIISPVSQGEHEAVRRAQRALKLSPTGDMDEATRASLRGVQSLFRLPVTGILDRATAGALDRLARTYPEES